MARLNRSLYERSEDEYFQQMTAAIEGKTAREMPEVGLGVALDLVEVVLPSAGLKKAVKKWRRRLVEAMGMAYVFATEESWEELDRVQARRLLGEAIVGVLREVRGQQASKADAMELPLPNRVETILRGLGSENMHFGPLREYVFSQPGYQRISHFSDLFLGMGRAMDRVKDRDSADYFQVTQFAWDQGLHVGFLEVIGEV
jgi:hypothetical protein